MTMQPKHIQRERMTKAEARVAKALIEKYIGENPDKVSKRGIRLDVHEELRKRHNLTISYATTCNIWKEVVAGLINREKQESPTATEVVPALDDHMQKQEEAMPEQKATLTGVTPIPQSPGHPMYQELRNSIERESQNGFPNELPDNAPMIFVRKWQQAFYLTLRGFTPSGYDQQNRWFPFDNSPELRAAYSDYHRSYEKYILASFQVFRNTYGGVNPQLRFNQQTYGNQEGSQSEGRHYQSGHHKNRPSY